MKVVDLIEHLRQENPDAKVEMAQEGCSVEVASLIRLIWGNTETVVLSSREFPNG